MKAATQVHLSSLQPIMDSIAHLPAMEFKKKCCKKYKKKSIRCKKCPGAASCTLANWGQLTTSLAD